MNSGIGLLVGTALVLLSAWPLAEAAPEPDQAKVITPFQAADQHGKPYTFEPKTTVFLLVSHDMKAGKQANVALDRMGAGFLESKQAVFLANIHGMPGIGRMFALRKMRKYAHRIILIDDEKLIARFPATPGMVTVLDLANGKVTGIRSWDPAKEKVDAALK